MIQPQEIYKCFFKYGITEFKLSGLLVYIFSSGKLLMNIHSVMVADHSAIIHLRVAKKGPQLGRLVDFKDILVCLQLTS